MNNIGFTHSNTNAPNGTVNAFQSRDQMMSLMGYKSINPCDKCHQVHSQREIFDAKTIKMPKMVVVNAPQHPIFSAKGGH